MKNIKFNSVKAGFSLVEMLVVIAVIGILAAIAVPNIGRINQSAETSKDRRNAQQISSVCNAASAAGLDFIDGSTDLEVVVGRVVTGSTVADTTSPFYNQFFGVPSISATEQASARAYLSIANGMLNYNSGL